MARLVANAPFDMFTFLTEGSLAEFFEFAEVITGTASQFVLRDQYDGIIEQLSLTGSFGGYSGGYPTTGTVTGGTYSLDGALFTFSSASISVQAFTDYVQTNDLAGLFIEMLRGADQLIGSSGYDALFGFEGNDSLDGGGGGDDLVGGFGNDSYYVNSVDDYVYENAGEGMDIVYSTASSYWLPTDETGFVENLTYIGSSSFTGIGNGLANIIRGGSGNDRLDGAGGADKLFGGNGNDTYYIDHGSDRAYELSATGGTDFVYTSVTHVLGANIERLVLTGTAATRGYGNELANVITGNAANNLIDGRAGADSMSGGAGNDTYYVDSAGDRVVEGAGAGTDFVYSSVSHTLSANVERLVLTGTAASIGTGNALANAVTGNGAANRLFGLAGADTLVAGAGNDQLNGGAGNDRLTGGTGLDKFIFDTALAGNVDAIMDFNVADDVILLDQTIFSGIAGLGTLSAGSFALGRTAQDANDRVLYDSATGRIYYDADGNGAGAAVLFATVTAGAALTASDFFVVA